MLFIFLLIGVYLFILFPSFVYFYFLFLFSVLFLFLSNFTFNASCLFLSLFYDEYFLFINFILFIVLFFSSIYRLNLLNKRFSFFLILVSLLVCFIVFSSSNIFILYLNYELSLIPIISIIIIWGSYPERSLSSIILLIYTSVFTIPFLIALWVCFSNFNSFFIFFYSYSSSYTSLSSFFVSFLVFIVFAVKLPIYGLHFWLPIAHVEAPTFGSIILAGVLLKLGGVGLVRCFSVIDFNSLSVVFLGYFVVILIYSTIVCCVQSDFKRIVAYSSVSHIIVIPILLFCIHNLRTKTIIISLLFHGLSSPLLFSLVGRVYTIFSRRQFILIRGILFISPLFRIFLVLGFLSSLSIPPYTSFLSEVIFFISVYDLWRKMFVCLILFRFLSLVYNLNWLTNIVFSVSSKLLSFSNVSIQYSYFYSILIISFIPFIFICIFMFI